MSDQNGPNWKDYNKQAAKEAAEETGVSEEYAGAAGHNARNDMAEEGWLDRPVKEDVDYDEDLHGSHDASEPVQDISYDEDEDGE
mgnify:CR=1 FL=1